MVFNIDLGYKGFQESPLLVRIKKSPLMGEQAWPILVALVGGLLLYRLLFMYSHDSREPPLVKPFWPIIGHAINIYKKGSRHFVSISKKYGYPIYSLPVPFGKIVIVNTPTVLSAIDKNPKAVAFAPIAAMVIGKLSGLSSFGHKQVMDKLQGEDRMEGYMNAVMKEIHTTLSPGPMLEWITRQVAYDLNDSIRSLHGKTTRMNLLPWFRHEFGMSSTNGIYGPQNPFKDPKVENGFWAFDDNISDLLITPNASLTCPSGAKGRADAWKGFAEYFINNGHEQGSELVKVRQRIADERGISAEDIGKLEVTMIIGILTNTVPTIFWAIYYIYRDEALLRELREEVSKIAVQSKDASGTKVWTLPSVQLKQNCPLLQASIDETFRHRTCGISSRYVTEDVVLNNQYLLKEGTIVELPNNVLHSEKAYWGETVEVFDPKRFLKGSNSKEAKMSRGAFRPFGGGASLCAGRHQATSQMLGGLALFIMSSDCDPVSGSWKFPGAHGHTIAAAVDLPSSDLWLDVKPRKGYEADYWVLDPESA